MISGTFIFFIFNLVAFLREQKEKISFTYLLTFFPTIIIMILSPLFFQFDEILWPTCCLVFYTSLFSSFESSTRSRLFTYIPLIFIIDSPSVILLGLTLFLTFEKNISTTSLLLLISSLIFTAISELTNTSFIVEFISLCFFVAFIFSRIRIGFNDLELVTLFIAFIHLVPFESLLFWSGIVLLSLIIYGYVKNNSLMIRAGLKSFIFLSLFMDLATLEVCVILYLIIEYFDVLKLETRSFSPHYFSYMPEFRIGIVLMGFVATFMLFESNVLYVTICFVLFYILMKFFVQTSFSIQKILYSELIHICTLCISLGVLL